MPVKKQDCFEGILVRLDNQGFDQNYPWSVG